ncbi:putative membrane protein YlbC [Weizmannia acidilactici]|nr:putative membrane protein YlbC [Weizmannia acidilactici]
MKTAVIFVLIFIVGLYFQLRPENGVLQNRSTSPKVDDGTKINKNGQSNKYGHPKSGMAVYIGKPVKNLTAHFGKPKRIDPSAYGYDWWIYNKKSSGYFQAGVKNGKIKTIYAVGKKLNVEPFRIGENVEEIYSSIMMNTDMTVQSSKGTYRFELSEEDLNIRPLVQLGDVYAQLALDKFSGQLLFIRFMDKNTLMLQHPYEMVYRGELPEPASVSEKKWADIETGSARQIFDITNIVRERFGLKKLGWDEAVADVAYKHSKDMAVRHYFSHESPKYGDLKERLNDGKILYTSAAENIAAHYMDGPAAVEGWLNSEGHRKALLQKDFTDLGVGVYQKYYTQDFIQKP